VAVGLGMDMALHCDIRYGSEHSRFMSYKQVGQIIENGGAYYLPKLIGLGRALEFAYTGDIDAKTAHEWGMLNRLFAAEELENEVRALADRIIKSPPIAQWINKRIIRAAADTTLEHTAVMTSNASFVLESSEDAVEARAALADRRDPVFHGR
jgi:enoyl-CoA hydratase/carnithine racemase